MSYVENMDLLRKYGYKYHKTKGKMLHPDGHEVMLNGSAYIHKNNKQTKVSGNTHKGLSEYLKSVHPSQHTEEEAEQFFEGNKVSKDDPRRLHGGFLKDNPSKHYAHGLYEGADHLDTNHFHDKLVAAHGGSSGSRGDFSVPHKNVEAFHKAAKAAGYEHGKHYSLASQHTEVEEPIEETEEQYAEEVKSTNELHGYHGEMIRKHKGDEKKAAYGYSKAHKEVRKHTGAEHQEAIHFLDSAHGRHLADDMSPGHIKQRYKVFKKDYDPSQYEEQKDKIEEIYLDEQYEELNEETPIDNKPVRKKPVANRGIRKLSYLEQLKRGAKPGYGHSFGR